MLPRSRHALLFRRRLPPTRAAYGRTDLHPPWRSLVGSGRAERDRRLPLHPTAGCSLPHLRPYSTGRCGPPPARLPASCWAGRDDSALSDDRFNRLQSMPVRARLRSADAAARSRPGRTLAAKAHTWARFGRSAAAGPRQPRRDAKVGGTDLPPPLRLRMVLAPSLPRLLGRRIARPAGSVCSQLPPRPPVPARRYAAVDFNGGDIFYCFRIQNPASSSPRCARRDGRPTRSDRGRWRPWPKASLPRPRFPLLRTGPVTAAALPV